MDVMATLTDAGAADTGPALVEAIVRGHEAPVKFLLQQQLGRPLADRFGYMDNSLDESGATPLAATIGRPRCSPRIAQLPIEAGASSTLPVSFNRPGGGAKPGGGG